MTIGKTVDLSNIEYSPLTKEITKCENVYANATRGVTSLLTDIVLFQHGIIPKD